MKPVLTISAAYLVSLHCLIPWFTHFEIYRCCSSLWKKPLVWPNVSGVLNFSSTSNCIRLCLKRSSFIFKCDVYSHAFLVSFKHDSLMWLRTYLNSSKVTFPSLFESKASIKSFTSCSSGGKP